MEIRINGQAADITLDSEKNIGEILAGIDLWLSNLGHSLTGLSIDGKNADTSQLDKIFSLETDSVRVLDIYTSSAAELTAMGLLNLIHDIEEFENLKFEDKSNFLDNWEKRAQAKLLKQNMPELFSLYIDLFSRGGISCQTLRSITEERLREVSDPADEFSKTEPLLNEICARLVDLPLDIQTGKDGRAAQTIQIFSGLMEKILRIINQFNIQGFLDQDQDDDKSLNQIINEFSGVLKELLDAYERQDSVLVGDLAEYEAAPRLQELFAAIQKKSRKPADYAQGNN